MTNDESIISDWDETALNEPLLQGREPTVRKIINITAFLAVVALMGASTHWWLGSVVQVWTTVFPPPAYTGLLFYGESGNNFVAVRSTDGHIQWHTAISGSDTTTILHDANKIYQIDNSTRQVKALQPQTGQQIWHLQTDASLSLHAGWLGGNHLYLLLSEGGALTTSFYLEEVDAQSGQVQWKSSLNGTDAFPATIHSDSIVLCSTLHVANSNTIMITLSDLDGQTGGNQWLQSVVMPMNRGYSCGEAGKFVFIQSISDTKANILSLFDEETGVAQRQLQFAGQIIGADQHTIYTSSAGVTSVEQNIQAVDLEDGKQSWHLAGNFLPFYIVNRQNTNTIFSSDILIALNNSGLVGINKKTGSVIWKWASAEVNGLQESSELAVQSLGNSLYFVGSMSAYALDSETGKIVWHLPLGRSVSWQVLYGQERVFLTSPNQIQALQAINGRFLWKQVTSLQNIFCLNCNS